MVSTAQEESYYSTTPTLLSGTGDIAYTVENKPSWLAFNQQTGTLSGTPDDADVGFHSNIIITVSNSVSSSSIVPFTIQVTPVNDVPEIVSQIITINNFKQSNSFSINYSDIDNRHDELTLTVQAPPEFGLVTQSESNPKQLIYTPTSVDGAAGDSFNVTISDGVSSSKEATIELVFQDQSAPSILISPVDGAVNVALSERISISSDDALDESTLTYSTSGTACTGSIHISSDNFSSCLAIDDIVMHDLNRRAEVILSSNLTKDTVYQIKVLNLVKNKFGTPLFSNLLANFKTVNPVDLISLSQKVEGAATEESYYSFMPTLLSGTGDITYSIVNKPNWLAFDQQTGALSGTPDDADVGLHSNIIITASNFVSSSTLGPFSINVTPVNDVPEITSQIITFNGFNQSNSFSLVYTDKDNTRDELTLNIQTQPEFGQVKQDESNPDRLVYTPTSMDGVTGDSFTVIVNDGVSSSIETNVELFFQDESAPNLSLIPVNGAVNVAVSKQIGIASDDSLMVSTLTYNTSDTECSGSIQVSSDNFSSCLVINSIEMYDLNKRAEIILSTPLKKDTEYQVKVLDQVQNIFGVNALSTLVSRFKTTKGLLITEISESYYNNTFCWFELYNPTSDVVDLSGYSFKSIYIDGSGSYKTDGNIEFSLPAVDIQPGQYVVIRSDKDGGSFTSNQRIVFAHEAGSYPYWGEQGYIDLLSNGVTQDFVTFGNGFSPVTSLEWQGSAATAPNSQADSYGASIGRDGNNTDTNSASDWAVYDYASMAGVNDVTCNLDADQDGIPDCSEQPGSTYAGLPLYEWGAREGQKDIFIELDYMDATNNAVQAKDEGILPRKEALQKVVDVFYAQGIAVHFDVGDLYDQAAGIDSNDFDLGGGNEIPFVDALTFGSAPSVYDLKLENFDYSRFQVFHYLIFANTQNGTAGSSGLAEINGNDLIVTLGEWGLNSSNTSNTNQLINYQASTLMHELGHNLGLSHGGDESENNKPNYFSIMNYLYQLSGLSEIGNNEGDRYYREYFSGNSNCVVSLTNPDTSTTFRMDFSHGASAPIAKNAANETTGLGQITTSGVDFNCDGDRVDTSAKTGQGAGSWTDYDDWGNINLDFRNYFSGNQNGLSLVASSRDTDLLMLDKVGDDRALVAEEYSPSAAFFEELKAQMNQ